jgi:hypothetical protein
METNGRNNLGRFAQGHPGFKKPKTELQRLTKTKLGEFLTSKLEDLDSIYSELSAKEKVRLIMALSEFFLPKMREHLVEIEDNFTLDKVDLTKLSPELLNELLTLAQNE